ncbi:hypothetical protein [Peptostreptococcus faecalis]|uniref:hypothetical protein n=1 Tax=Peptostreptococcus faecalis TaxID=2045015 RepID=UPI000C79EC7F|nr:hypothetical protein [Peptostreptococcus faecalis]
MAEIKDEEYEIVKKWLYDYKGLESDIKQYDLQIEEIKNDITGCSGISYEGEKLAPTYNISKTVENEVLDREKRIEEVEAKKRKMIIHKKKMDIAINNLDSDQKILFDYEFKKTEGKLSIDVISNRMGISNSTFYSIKNSIILSVINSLNPDRTLRFIEKQFKML